MVGTWFSSSRSARVLRGVVMTTSTRSTDHVEASDPDHNTTHLTQLVESHLGLADHLARRYRGRGVDRDDLDQVARLALVKAARSYRPERGAFAPYASATVQGELKKHFRDHAWSVRPPRRLQDLQAAITAADDEHGVLDDAALAEHLGVPSADVREARAASGCYSADSLDRPFAGSELTLGDTLPHDEGGYEHAEEWASVRTVCRELSADDRDLIGMRFFQDRTQQDIADELGISQMQVSRRLRSVLERIRSGAGLPAVA